MAQFTKKAIMKTFLELLNEYSLDKITVKDIVEKCGINRNTFYYYYKDIYDLIDDIFRTEIQSVQANIKEGTSFYEELHLGINLVLENKTSFAHLYHSKSRDVIEKYLDNIAEVFVQKFVEKKAAELSITNERNIRFIYSWYRYSITGVIINWIQTDNASAPEAFIHKIADVYESTITDALLSTCKYF